MVSNNFHFRFQMDGENYDLHLNYKDGRWDPNVSTSSKQAETIEKIKAAFKTSTEAPMLSSSLIKETLLGINANFIEETEQKESALLAATTLNEADKVGTEALAPLKQHSSRDQIDLPLKERMKTETEQKKAIESSLVPPSSTVSHQIDDLLKEKMKDGFSGSVCVVEKGKVILQKGYGAATAKTNNGPATTFRLASLTKTLTAAAILRLNDQKQLDINKPICGYLPVIQEKIDALKAEEKELQAKGDNEGVLKKQQQIEWLSTITVLNLINHQSGLPSFPQALYEKPFAFEQHSIDDVIARCAAQNPPVNFKPGTNKGYSNYGYVLLAKIIENVTKQSYDKAMDKLVFGELKMASSSCPSREEDDHPQAQGLTTDKETISPTHASTRIGTGNAISNTIDLAKFDQALSQGYLSQASLKIMEENGWDVSGRDAQECILWDPHKKFTDDQYKENRKWALKQGDMHGCHTSIARLPDLQSSVIILGNTEIEKEGWSNGGNLMGLCMDVAGLLVKNSISSL